MEFYKFNVSNHLRNLNESELKDLGGVCWHYTNWYQAQLKDSPYNLKEVLIDINKTTKHKFLISSNTDGYCILDQFVVKCFNFKINYR
jgi:hypothetical protein